MHGLFHFAYLDAGTGSLIVQSVIGIFAAAAVFGRRMLAKVGHVLFRRGRKADQAVVSKTTKADAKPAAPLRPTVAKPSNAANKKPKK